ncbi:DUF1552 domain-containing protein [Rohdeia mirabilis]
MKLRRTTAHSAATNDETATGDATGASNGSRRTPRMLGQALDRRTALHGIGAFLALPLLEAMQPSALRLGPAPKVPPRLVYVYVPNGVHMPAWTPEREGRNFPTSRILEPLGDLKKKVAVLSGLTHDKARANGDGPGDHARAAATWLTGTQAFKDSSVLRCGISADQLAAAEVGHETRFRSLELGCELGQGSGECDSGYACAYNFNISWKSASQPATQEVNPRKLFDRLFGEATSAESAAAAALRRERGKSLLDYVNDEVRRLRKDLGGNDRQKIEEYLEGLREIERKIDFDSGDDLVLPEGSTKPTGIPKRFSDHCRLMYQMLALALRTDQTRVATFMYLKEVSGRTYPEIDVREGHHALSHHGDNADNHRKLEKINTLHVSLLAEFLRDLDSVVEDRDTLLDHTMVCYGSGISDGDKHNHEDLPTLLAGGGELKRGLKLDRHEQYKKDTPMNDLHLALLDRMGVEPKEFGDAERALSI